MAVNYDPQEHAKLIVAYDQTSQSLVGDHGTWHDACAEIGSGVWGDAARQLTTSALPELSRIINQVIQRFDRLGENVLHTNRIMGDASHDNFSLVQNFEALLASDMRDAGR
jgi:hypothetical protein